MSDAPRVIGEIRKAIQAYRLHDREHDFQGHRGSDLLAVLLCKLSCAGLITVAELEAMLDDINTLPRSQPEFGLGMIDLVERYCPDWRVRLTE